MWRCRMRRCLTCDRFKSTCWTTRERRGQVALQQSYGYYVASRFRIIRRLRARAHQAAAAQAVHGLVLIVGASGSGKVEVELVALCLAVNTLDNLIDTLDNLENKLHQSLEADTRGKAKHHQGQVAGEDQEPPEDRATIASSASAMVCHVMYACYVACCARRQRMIAFIVFVSILSSSFSFSVHLEKDFLLW